MEVLEFDVLSSIHPSLQTEKKKEENLPETTNFAAELDLTIPQIEFYELEVQYPLFVAGFGSGKSKTLAICALRDLINYPGANIGIYAPTYDLMSLILVPYISELLEDGGYAYSYNGSSHIFSVAGLGRIICRSLDTPRRIVGYETFRAHCDELDTLPLEKAEDAWNKVIARNRQKVYIRDEHGQKVCDYDEDDEPVRDEHGNIVYKMHKNRVSAYTTPEGWNFAYKRWEEDPAEGYQYVRASTYSNQHNLPPDYIPNLKASYPPELVEAYIDGIFTNLTSGRVYRNFDRKLNSSEETVRSDDVLFIGMDFNVEHGCAGIHVERYDDEGEVCDHAVDEIADSYDTDDTIRILKERYPNHQIKVYPDASGAFRDSATSGVDSKGQATHTDIWKLEQAGFEIIVNHSNPAIKDRVAAYSARICDGNGKRRYFVNTKKCPAITKTLEQQVWNNGVPDKSLGLDHMGDACGYCMVKKYPPIEAKEGFVKVQNNVRVYR